MQRLENAEGACTSDGLRIWYRIEGAAKAGAPIVLLHGGPGATARPFERTIGPLFALARPVVYVDCRGAGRSDRPSEPAAYSLCQLARDLEAVRSELGVECWVIFGHSLGAATALTYAAGHAARVAALVLCSPLIRSSSSREAGMAQKVLRAPETVQAEARRIYRADLPPEEKVDRLLRLIDQKSRYALQFYTASNSRMMDEIQGELERELGRGLMDAALWQGLSAAGIGAFDGFDLLPSLSMPQAVLVSPFDSEVSVEDAMRYAALAADGTLLLVRHSGHHPYLEETATCAQQIGDFLATRGI